MLTVPRRPKWTAQTTAEELQRAENESFLEWRRTLALLQEYNDILLTPYEKNLEFWRQLWRVVERSDVVVQIVDTRNPLLFRSVDLERYVKEVNPNKMNMISSPQICIIDSKPASNEIDKQFFDSNNSKAYVKGRINFPHIRLASDGSLVSASPTEKPWRSVKKERREKLRKKF